MTAALKLETIERRKDPRYPAMKQAVIRQRRGPDVACMIDNVSEGGALLVLEEARAVPQRFTVYVPGDDVELICICKRVHGVEVAVAFVRD